MGIQITGPATLSGLYKAPTTAKEAAVGSVAEDELGGRWRYCKAGADISNPIKGAGCYSQPTDCTAGAGSVVAVGSFTLAVSSCSPARTAVANDYENGCIIIGAAAANRRFYMIQSNTAGTTTTTTLTLYSPLIYAVAGTEWATIVPSPWADVRDLSAAGGYMSVVCWPLQPVTSGYYFWGKTRGPVFGVGVSTVPGITSADRTTTFNASDGALYRGTDAYGGTSMQWAGYLIPRTMGTYNAGDQTIMTQLE